MKPRTPKPEEKGFGTFTGISRLQLYDTYQQILKICFDLQIDPSHCINGPVDCRVTLDEVSVSASRVESSQTAVRNCPEHFFVTERVWIIIGPSKGDSMGPRAPQPRMRYFYQSLSESSSWQGGITVGAPTKIAGTVSYAASKLTERSAIAVEVNPIRIGAGIGQDFEWVYKTRTGSSDTHVEFSSSNPPVHHVTYRLGADAPSPEDMRLRVKALFRQCGKITRSQSRLSLPLYVRSVFDRKFRHIELELEVRVGKEGDDNFQFPASNKSGCHLVMDMNIDKGKIWQGDPGKTDVGVIKSKLESFNLSRG